MSPPRGRIFPFAPKGSSDWLSSHVTYDQAVEMFFNQTATQQHMGISPLVCSLVFRGVKYATLQEAQQVHTSTMNAEYEAREQRDLADENRGSKASKTINDQIRNRIVPTENGLESPELYKKPFGEKCSSFSSLVQSLTGQPTSETQSIASSSTPQITSEVQSKAAQQAYDFTKPEWDKSLQEDAKEYVWDTTQQETISIAVLLIEEAREYLQLLQNETYGEMSAFKDNTGLASGFKGAYDVAKDLGAFGATAKAVNINGTMNIVIENYKPRYLDLGIKWQEATPQMMKIGYALNTVKGNLSVIKGNVFVEIVFSGAINAVDYMLHDEKTLGEVVGRLSGDIAKGIVAGLAAQAVVVVGLKVITIGLGAVGLAAIAVPTAVTIGLIAVGSFFIGKKLSELDNENNNYQYTKPMADSVEAYIDDLQKEN